MELVLEDWLHEEIVATCFFSDSPRLNVIVGGQEANVGSVYFPWKTLQEFANQLCGSRPIAVRHAEVHQDELLHASLTGPSLHCINCCKPITADVFQEAELREQALHHHLVEAAIVNKQDLILG